MRDGETERLAEIDRQADQLFLETGIENIMALVNGPPTPVGEFGAMLDACSVDVACTSDGVPVGLAAALMLVGDIYLRLLAVNPDHGRRGIGSSLLTRVMEKGRQSGAARCVLSTFRDVSFNQPFYRSHGFSELSLQTATPELKHRFTAEVPEGVDAAQRLLMARDL